MPLLDTQRIVAFGELHGTVEIPQLVGNAVCHAAAAGRQVILAIEHDAREQAAIDHAVATGDTTRMLAEPLWTRKFQEGRSSVAMRDLILRVHALRTAGFEVSVRAIDAPDDHPWSERDPHMAGAVVRAATEHPRALVVVLAGLSHVWKVENVPAMPDHRSAMLRVIEQGLHVHTIEVRQTDAEHWGCMPRDRPEPDRVYTGPLVCERHRIGDPSRRIATPVLTPYPGRLLNADDPLELTLPADAFDAQIDLGGLSASPPAVATGK